MTEQWQELKETIKELRYSNGNLTQQEVCSFLGVYMETLEKQMQESTYAKGTIIKSALKYLVKRQIAEGSVGFAVDNDHDHDCCWDDVLAWLEAPPNEEDFVKHKKEVLERIAKREREIDKYIKELETLEQQPTDAVSRSEVLDEINEIGIKGFVNYGFYSNLYDFVDSLPSVIPKYTDEEIDKAQAVEQAYVDKMVELAVEEAKRPKGKWIKYKSRFGTEYFKCSECGRKLNWIDSDDNYCNSCGSDNSESTKELYKEKLAEISGGGEDETSN